MLPTPKPNKILQSSRDTRSPDIAVPEPLEELFPPPVSTVQAPTDPIQSSPRLHPDSSQRLTRFSSVSSHTQPCLPREGLLDETPHRGWLMSCGPSQWPSSIASVHTPPAPCFPAEPLGCPWGTRDSPRAPVTKYCRLGLTDRNSLPASGSWKSKVSPRSGRCLDWLLLRFFSSACRCLWSRPALRWPFLCASPASFGMTVCLLLRTPVTLEQSLL